MAVYVVLGALAAVENVLPPVPADAAVALGAFLSQRGVTTPVGVFLVVWTFNIAGATGVYFAARRFGRQWFASHAGRRLLSPEALSVIEREYLRFGVIGIFLARFLPGIRAVVPVFAGIANLSPQRAIPPMALASAVWYGAITIFGAVVGAEWERISSLVQRVNTTLGILAAVVAVALGAWYLRARRRRHERVWTVVSRALGDGGSPREHPRIDGRAAALVVLELAYADDALTPGDRALVAAHLRERWDLEPKADAAADPPAMAPGRMAALRSRIVDRFGRRDRLALVERMWHVAFAEGAIGAPADRVMARAGELLGLAPADIAEARRRATGAPSAP